MSGSPTPFAPTRVLGIGLIDGGPAHLRRHVEVRGGLGLMEPDRPGQPPPGVVDMALEGSHAEARHRAASNLVREAQRMHDLAAVRDAQVIDDLDLAGLDIELDLDESRRQRGDGPALLRIVPGRPP